MCWRKVIVLLSILTLSLLFQSFQFEESFQTKKLKRRIRENKYAIKKGEKAIKKNRNAIYGKYKNGKWKVKTQIEKNQIAIGNNESQINDNHSATESTLKTIQDDMLNNYARIPRQYETY